MRMSICESLEPKSPEFAHESNEQLYLSLMTGCCTNLAPYVTTPGLYGIGLYIAMASPSFAVLRGFECRPPRVFLTLFFHLPGLQMRTTRLPLIITSLSSYVQPAIRKLGFSFLLSLIKCIRTSTQESETERTCRELLKNTTPTSAKVPHSRIVSYQ